MTKPRAIEPEPWLAHPRAIDLEIYEAPPPSQKWPDRDVSWAPIKPNRIRINGIECLTPSDRGVIIDPLLADGDNLNPVLVATITVFVRSLKVHGGEPQ